MCLHAICHLGVIQLCLIWTFTQLLLLHGRNKYSSHLADKALTNMRLPLCTTHEEPHLAHILLCEVCKCNGAACALNNCGKSVACLPWWFASTQQILSEAHSSGVHSPQTHACGYADVDPVHAQVKTLMDNVTEY